MQETVNKTLTEPKSVEQHNHRQRFCVFLHCDTTDELRQEFVECAKKYANVYIYTPTDENWMNDDNVRKMIKKNIKPSQNVILFNTDVYDFEGATNILEKNYVIAVPFEIIHKSFMEEVDITDIEELIYDKYYSQFNLNQGLFIKNNESMESFVEKVCDATSMLDSLCN